MSLVGDNVNFELVPRISHSLTHCLRTEGKDSEDKGKRRKAKKALHVKPIPQLLVHYSREAISIEVNFRQSTPCYPIFRSTHTGDQIEIDGKMYILGNDLGSGASGGTMFEVRKRAKIWKRSASSSRTPTTVLAIMLDIEDGKRKRLYNWHVRKSDKKGAQWAVRRRLRARWQILLLKRPISSGRRWLCENQRDANFRLFSYSTLMRKLSLPFASTFPWVPHHIHAMALISAARVKARYMVVTDEVPNRRPTWAKGESSRSKDSDIESDRT
ncbi:hypothetical protein CPB85DRAFT_1251098 [Mucidula mucida]|nr:hypothetical protein CPB85DRAFT_1251098 [Mucidula mucida]